MAIIFRVMQLDEISQGEGRMGEKSPGQAFPPALRGQARKGTCQDTGGKPGECSVPRPGGVVLRERELSTRPAAAGRSSQMTTEKQPVCLAMW